ncbi:undecaprenyl-diphosphate phosphatase [Deinococcus cellulosilyticus]|uniref:Undecaprenyl-diphosphatase n=1 Tax=Deinococcus cellulosilyticus (strain DSM 18568 / NBRC 106333 / KACC 11606 / 5516J-15) TaxID=1223518 RepID=A0A511N181_DEIC1|nr:undecaprenyl-diphosphate phosphatase [Deinococcus cellulosilyticus]GEM46640.1 undecaprenyl-diphosphatase 2 [Deinococcus cellulosilyticus NBRC 106333 = KACC 11606]
MNETLSSVMLGVTEGITEFLPVSSTGHLIVTSQLLGVEDTGGTFEIAIQLGAVLAVVWHYRHDLLLQAKQASHPDVKRQWGSILLAFVPAAVLGFLFSSWITLHLFSVPTVAAALIIGGVLMLVAEGLAYRVGTRNVQQVRPLQALMVGGMQCLALIPGMSRSATTIIGGMFAGMDRSTATQFSFYLSIPTLGLATLYALGKNLSALQEGQLLNLLVGMVAAFFMALLAVGWLLRYVSKHNFRLFAWYRILFGTLLLALTFRGVLA